MTAIIRAIKLALIWKGQLISKEKKNFTRKNGYSLVEILIAIAIFISIATAITYLLLDASVSFRQGKERVFATSLAEEGLEAARNIRDSGWDNLASGNHGIIVSSNSWNFAEESDLDPSGRFSRQIKVENAGDDRKLVTSTVSWDFTPTRQGNVTLTTYLNNWAKIIEPPELPTWNKPITIGTVSTNNIAGNKNPNDIFVLGNYVYLVTDEANAVDPEFFIFDVSDVTKPTLVSTCKIGSKVNAVYVVGNYAYLATSVNDAELTIIKVSDPKNPTVVARLNTPENQDGEDVFILDNYAYLVTQNNPSDSEFYIFDVLDPENPVTTPVGKFELNAQGRAIYVAGNYAYVGTNSDAREVVVINVTNKSGPQNVRYAYNNPDAADVNDIYVNGSTVYLATEQNGASGPNFVIVYANTSSYPGSVVWNLIGQFHNAADVNGLWPDMATNQVFLATETTNKEFVILDITNPSQPLEKAAIDLPDKAVAIAYNGAYVFVASIANNQELIIIGPS